MKKGRRKEGGYLIETSSSGALFIHGIESEVQLYVPGDATCEVVCHGVDQDLLVDRWEGFETRGQHQTAVAGHAEIVSCFVHSVTPQPDGEGALLGLWLLQGNQKIFAAVGWHVAGREKHLYIATYLRCRTPKFVLSRSLTQYSSTKLNSNLTQSPSIFKPPTTQCAI